jgi:hypothetical protein
MSVGKSNSRKKQERAKAAARRAELERRRVKAARQRQSAERYDQLSDPSASPAHIAEILAAELPERVLAADMMRLRMSLGVPAEEVAETARLLLDCIAPEPPGIGALAVAALAAHLAGDEDAEHGYAGELLARATASRDPGQRLEVIRSTTGRDHPGETCELIEPYLREHPDDELAADIYARALAKAHVQAEPGGELETAALDRFRDRCDADALDRAVDEFTNRTPWGAIIRKWMDDERAGQKTKRSRPAEQDTIDALMAEVAVFFPFTGEAGDAEKDDGAPDTPLRAFAADPETPTELAARAAERDEHVRYGVWQVADPSPSPGVWCTDLVSGVRQYAQFPARVTDGAPPWSVWLGALAPTGGIWRVTRAGIWLSPVEGDAVAEYAEAAVWDMLSTITGERGDYPPALEQVRFGQADPYCVRWETGEEPEPEFGDFAGPVIARLAPRLASWVWLKRAERVLLQNTDDESMVLIDAAVTVDGDVAEKLLARSDFGEEENGVDGQLVWWGELVDDRSDEPVVLHFHGGRSAHVTGPDDDEEERVVLGRLTPEPGRVRIQVNSQHRLKRLMRILKEIGAAPQVTEESRSEPCLDFAWGPVPGHGLTARQWAEAWLGQAVAVLDFHTPRHAAEGGQADRLRLEGLLRQLEYQSALPAERGGGPIDTAWLRAELGLESMKHNGSSQLDRSPGAESRYVPGVEYT